MGSPSTKISMSKPVPIPKEIFSKMESDPNISKTEANFKKKLEAEKGTKMMLKKINKYQSKGLTSIKDISYSKVMEEN